MTYKKKPYVVKETQQGKKGREDESLRVRTVVRKGWGFINCNIKHTCCPALCLSLHAYCIVCASVRLCVL